MNLANRQGRNSSCYSISVTQTITFVEGEGECLFYIEKEIAEFQHGVLRIEW